MVYNIRASDVECPAPHLRRGANVPTNAFAPSEEGGHVMRKVMIILVAVLILGLLTTTVGYAAPPAYGPTYHRVRYGETLFSIGRLYGVNPYAIARANCLPNPNRIYAGQLLLIPTGQSWHRIHIVAYGETLVRIARWYGVSPWSIARANGIWNLNCIYAGQRLIIP
jgi:LysM repeat protein